MTLTEYDDVFFRGEVGDDCGIMVAVDRIDYYPDVKKDKPFFVHFFDRETNRSGCVHMKAKQFSSSKLFCRAIRNWLGVEVYFVDDEAGCGHAVRTWHHMISNALYAGQLQDWRDRNQDGQRRRREGNA
jgi:hypothetical protein